MRVHELAKELGVPSKDLLDKLHSHQVDAKNHMAALTPEQVELVRKLVGKPAVPAPAPAAPTAAAAPKAAPTPVAKKEPAAAPKPPPPPAPPKPKVIIVRGPIIVKEFAEQLGLKTNQLIAELMTMNVFASVNERVDLKVAQQLAEKHGFSFEHEKKVVEHKPLPKPSKPVEESEEDKPEDLIVRPPIVTFLGHVDHGKTSLLDRIRHSKVAASEDGGITQHIGAYQVSFRDQLITFLDTPGHAAFTAMRARGANLTDIAVIVIAADDGIMPQTKEAIQHAKASGVSIMVAINKTDLRAANIDRVKRQLQQEGLSSEDWGGTVVCCPVSALTGDGIDHLLEMILLQAEVLELKANPKRRAQGYIIEARLEAGMGPTATVLVRRGTLHVGDAMVCGLTWGRVKALINDQGIKVRTAGPSSAVKCLGLTGVPEPGAEIKICPTDREARSIAEKRQAEKRMAEVISPKRASLEDLLRPTSSKDAMELPIILKTDVQGSLEAIQQALLGIKSEKVVLHILLSGVGGITVNDVLLASASKALIVGFHVGKEDGVAGAAKREGVEIRLYSIIYELLDEVREAMTGLLEPVVKETMIGHAEIRQVFDLGKKGSVAGCMVTDGRVTSRAKARIRRNGEMLYAGHVSSLKRFQNDASEVREGQECGIRLDNFSQFQAGDTIEFYEIEKIAQQL